MDTCRNLHDFALIQPKPSPGKLFFRQNGPATAALQIVPTISRKKICEIST